MIEALTNLYSVSKTLRFSLIPMGKTLDNLKFDRILESDKKRAEEYADVKKLIDRFHKAYIEKRLSVYEIAETELARAADCYEKNDAENLTSVQADIMKKISQWLTGSSDAEEKTYYQSLFSDKMVKKYLPEYLTDTDEKNLVSDFSSFWTYFSGFCKNRENMYTGEGKSTEIAFRIVMQNLPKFLDNLKTWKKLSEILPPETIAETDREMKDILGMTSGDIFRLGAFNRFLSQSGIDRYNQYIGGYSNEDGSKIQGLNERINLYAQSTGERLPKLKPLFKQILSESDSISYIPVMFDSDQQMLDDVRLFTEQLVGTLEKLHELLQSLENFDAAHIYVSSGTTLTAVSAHIYGNWSWINTGLNLLKEKNEKGFTKERKSYPLSDLAYAAKANETDEEQPELIPSMTVWEDECYHSMMDALDAAETLLTVPYPQNRAFAKTDEDIQTLKNALDSVKEYQRCISMYEGTGTEADKDSLFYGQYEELAETLKPFNHLYDRVRNYVTKKPFSTDKMRLMFNRSDFLNGWAQPGEWGKQEAHLFEKDGKYYIFITSRTLKESEWSIPLFSDVDSAPAQYLEYRFQKPDNKNTPRLFVRSKGTAYAPAVKEYKLPLDDVIDIYDNGYFKTEYRKKDPEGYHRALTKMIDYFKLGFSRHESYKDFRFDWKPSDEYADISEFYRDTANSCYGIRKEPVNFNGLLSMTENNLGYLFEIYSKDFSVHSHGTPNLHTLYFKALFDETNSGDIRLQGGAQVFFREASLKPEDTTIHPANQPIKNKNPLNPKKESVYSFDLIKDRRYTIDHFELHFPVLLNAKAAGYVNLNHIVRDALRSSSGTNIIGIDRGERNLLYICVIDPTGKILEQVSLNQITSGNGAPVDYHALLDQRESERKTSRENWTAIENIKDLKEGYLSQAIHVICELAKKYDAVIAMEDLNSGFKNTRVKVEHSVYQKFETMLTNKLQYVVDKKTDPQTAGGIFHALQLSNMADAQHGNRQDGIIFYVPAWLTSKIDPTTGFIDLLKPKYESIAASRAFFGSFDRIAFCEASGLFEFDIDYSRFPKGSISCRKKWTVCSYGERILTFRNPEKNNNWDTRTVKLTEAFLALFRKYGIDTAGDLREAITAQTTKEFFKEFIMLFALTLQMRNSITGTDVDYLISPVRGKDGTFFDSREVCDGDTLPRDADANGAYNIARKCLWAVGQIRNASEEELDKVNLSVSNKEWLAFAQDDHE